MGWNDLQGGERKRRAGWVRKQQADIESMRANMAADEGTAWAFLHGPTICLKMKMQHPEWWPNGNSNGGNVCA